MRLGWDAVTLAGLRDRFRENGLDELARALVRMEVIDRGAQVRLIEGPAPAGVRDGGREVEVVLEGEAPLREADYRERFSLTTSLLGDASLVAVSCKTGRDLASVRKDALKDARGDEGGDRSAEVLRLGGRLILMTTQAFTAAAAGAVTPGPGGKKSSGAKPKRAPQAVGGKESLIGDLADAYAKRTGRSQDELKKQIAVVDGNDLVEYVRLRMPLELGEALLALLGVDEWPSVLNHAAAIEELEAERTLPEYIPDGSRELLTRQIRALVAERPSMDGALCVVGPPGVGKTRCVLESVRDDKARVMYVVGDAVAQRLLEDDRILLRAPGGILIVDDARPEEVGALFATFRRARRGVGARPDGPSPRLVVIVPAGTFESESFGRIPLVPLGPLGERQARALVATVLGDDPGGERAERVFRVTGGYPWFGMLVAQEITAGSAVPETTTGAARLAISPDAAGKEQRVRLVRALLAAMIAHEARWDDLDDSAREKLALAVDLPTRGDLNAAITRCVERGVLRRDAFLYVTPAVLEREVWRILRDNESPTDPGAGNRRLLQRIRTHVPELAAPLIDRLLRLDLSLDELGDAARVMLEALREEVTALEDLAPADRASMLSLCVQGAPEEAGRWLGALVVGTSEETLRARADLRRLLVTSLDAIARRGAAFDAIDGALFALRLAENEAYSNNASQTWLRLYTTEFDHTGVSFDQRLRVLETHCLEGEVGARVSAIRGVAELLTFTTVVNRPDGEERARRVAPTERRRARGALWSLLLRCMSDPDPIVAEAAQRQLPMVVRLASDLLGYLPADAELERAVRGLAEPVRASVRRELEVERRLEGHADLPSASVLARLDALTRPQDYAQRLRDHLARDAFAGVEEGSAKHDDEALAREGLAPPDRPLLRHVDLLEEDAAVRAMPFAIVAGRIDTDCVLLAPLVQSAATGTGTSALVAYCLGHYEAGRQGHVLAWLKSWRDDPRLTATILVTAARCGGAEALMRLAVETLRERDVPPVTLRYFATPPWRELSDVTLRDALRLLVDRFGAAGASAAMRQLQHQLQQRDGDALEPLVLEVTSRAAAVLASADAWAFEQCLRWLLARGRADEVSSTLMSALAAERLAGRSLFKLAADVAARSPGAFWEALRVRLEPNDDTSDSLVTRLAHSDAGAHLPRLPVLDWVGLDESRAQKLVWLVSLDDAELSPLAVHLIERFGATSRTARALSAVFEGTPRPVSSLARFYEERRDRARAWSESGSPAVRAWAEVEVESLERRRAWYAADEASERRRFGT